jgi:hypothetical protein
MLFLKLQSLKYQTHPPPEKVEAEEENLPESKPGMGKFEQLDEGRC